MIKRNLVIIFCSLITAVSHEQATENFSMKPLIDSADTKYRDKGNNKFPLPGLIVPTVMLGYGVISISSHILESVNANIKEEVYTEHPHQKTTIDTYLQFAPAAAVYGLDALGIQAKHNFRDRSMIYLMSNVILNGTVYSVKKYSHVLRPDGSSYTSFPSGHTAEAFASAEFLWQEYKDVSTWYGVAGYTAAVATGYLRMYNNRHWFGDVVAGAGVGIISTKLAYWLYPKIQHVFFKSRSTREVFIIPSCQNRSLALAMECRF
jgi:hypothetical protein